MSPTPKERKRAVCGVGPETAAKSAADLRKKVPRPIVQMMREVSLSKGVVMDIFVERGN